MQWLHHRSFIEHKSIKQNVNPSQSLAYATPSDRFWLYYAMNAAQTVCCHLMDLYVDAERLKVLQRRPYIHRIWYVNGICNIQ